MRCFAGKQHMDVRPITFLVGNNSTGKTTVLGCLRNMIALLTEDEIANFNQYPYRMGGFADILHKNSRNRQFSLQACYLVHDRKVAVNVDFVDSNGSPAVKQVRYLLGDGSITCKFASSQTMADNLYEISETAKNKFTITFNREKAGATRFSWPLRIIIGNNNNSASMAEKHLARFAKSLAISFTHKKNGKATKTTLHPSYYFFHDYTINDFGPVRSQPERVYPPTSIPPAQGYDTPMKLMHLKHEDNKLFGEIIREMKGFGQATGLFDDVDVREMDNSLFQLLVKTATNKATIADVGYGVSQIFPILFEILMADLRITASKHRDHGSHIVLIQQPEVHLHPRAQAELTSLLARIAGRNPGKFRFLIETHSDFIVDRASIEIRNKTIAAKDVSLAFFNMEKASAKIANIGYDNSGNLINVPNGYRKFFNDETNRFLGLN